MRTMSVDSLGDSAHTRRQYKGEGYKGYIRKEDTVKAWYLFYCKRAQLLCAQVHLERQGLVCLTPIVAIKKMWRGRRVTLQEPLFPNYLFTEFNSENIHTTKIKSTRGVS